MPFSISEYILRVEKRLEVLDHKKIIIFAVWCSERLFNEFRNVLEQLVWKSETRFVEELIDEAWRFAVNAGPVNNALLERVKLLCENAELEDEDSDNQMDEIGAIETVEAILLLGNALVSFEAKSAAMTAEKVINKVYFEIQFAHEEDNEFDHPFMIAELERQQAMMSRLENNTPLDLTVRSL